MITIQVIREMIREEASARFDVGTVIAADVRGDRVVGVRLSGTGVVTRAMTCVEDLQAGDRVIVVHITRLDRMVVVAQILDEHEGGLSRRGQLSPPKNLTYTPIPAGVEVRWDTWPGEDLSWQVRYNSSAADAGATDVLITRGSHYFHWTVDASGDMDTAATTYFKARALRWLGDSNVMFSGWSAWSAAQTSGGHSLRELIEVEFEDATMLTLDAAGAITRTQVYHRVDTFGGAATDDLDTINGGTEGDLLIIRPEDGARTIVVKHDVDNIWLLGGADITLDELNDHLMLVYSSTNFWCDISGGGGGGGAANFLALADTPGSYAGEKADLIQVNQAENALEFVTASQDVEVAAAGVATVIGLQTRPVSDEQPEEGDVLQWIVDASGCPGTSDISEFWGPSESPATDTDTFLELTDTPATYAGAANYLTAVDPTESFLQWIAAAGWLSISDISDLAWQPDAVAVLHNGRTYEYADPDDAFTAAVAGDTIMIPPGTWILSSAHNVIDVDILGIGSQKTCILRCVTTPGTPLIGMQGGVGKDFRVEYEGNSGGHLRALYAFASVELIHVEGYAYNAGSGEATGIEVASSVAGYECYGEGETEGGRAYGIHLALAASELYYCEGRAKTRSSGEAHGIWVDTNNCTIYWSYGWADGTGGTNNGLNLDATGCSAHHCTFLGDDAGINLVAAATLSICSCQYNSINLGGGAAITQLLGDRAGTDRAEVITGAWTFNDDITMAAGKTVDGVDVGDHSARHDIGGADVLTTTQGDVASEIVATDANKGIKPTRLGVGVAVPGADGDAAVAGNIILSGAAKAVRATGSVVPTLGTTTEAEKFGHAYLALTKDAYPDGETDVDTGLWKRFVNKYGLSNYTHHRGTGVAAPAGTTVTATPANLWAAWLAGYIGWFKGTYYQHYPNHATLPAGLTVHTADPISNDVKLVARVHTMGGDWFGLWADNFDADRNYAIGEYIYRYDVYTYGNGPETLLYDQVATSVCTNGGVGVLATFAAWVNHANNGPYGPFCPCGDGIVLQVQINHTTSNCIGRVIGEQGSGSNVGNYSLYDDAWPGTSLYAARRCGTFQRLQGYGRAVWDWYYVDT